MSLSTSTVFISEDLDNANVLEEQASSHFISDEPSSCLFDISSSTQAGNSLDSPLLEDIGLDLQWEDEDVESANNAVIEGMAEHTVYNFNAAVYSTSVCGTVDAYRRTPFIPPPCLIEDQSSDCGSQAVEFGSRQFTLSFPLSHSQTNKSNAANLKGKTFTACRHCAIQFSSKEALLIHNKDQHVKKEIHLYECTYCHTNFENKKSLAKHFKIHKEKPGEKHETCKESPENRVFLCESCPYVGKTRTRLNDHIKAKHSLQRNVYSCEKCNFSCIQEQTLTLHHQRHEGEPKFACDQCGKLFLTMSILKRHAHTHNKTRAFLCQFQRCGKSFNIKSRLTDHIRTVHKNRRQHLDINSASDNNNPTTCTSDEHISQSKLQDSSFAKDCKPNNKSEHPVIDINVSTYTPDLNSADIFIYDVILPEDKIHNFNSAVEENKLRASPCSKVTMNNTNIAWNKSQTSFCSVSNVRINQCYNSQSYFSQKDVNEKKFACTWDGCDKTFRDNYNLYVHRCTHTGEMQRACNLCRYRCVQKSAMDAHMKTHNKVKQKDTCSRK